VIFHAFTMLELILAVGLMALLVVMLVAAADSMTASAKRLDAEKRKMQTVLVLDRALDSMLSGIVPFTWPDDNGDETVGVFQGTPQAMTFAYRHRINNATDGGLRFARLRCTDRPGSPNRGAGRSD